MSLMGYTETDIRKYRSALWYQIETNEKIGLQNDFTAILEEIDDFLLGLLEEGRV